MAQARVINGVSTASGGTTTADFDTRRLNTLTVAYKLAGTVTAGDLTINDPLPFDVTGQPLTVGLPPEAQTAPASDGANVVAVRRYDVSGVERVRLGAKNNNVGALALTVDVFASNVGQG